MKGTNKYYITITSSNFVKKCQLFLIVTYIPLIIVGIIIANLYGPNGFTLWTHYISDLGVSNNTPTPYLYDIACIVAGIFLIPFSIYTSKLLMKIPEVYSTKLLLLKILGYFTLLFSLLGNITYIGVGIFSLDRNPYNMHEIMSGFAFTGFVVGIMLMSTIILLYECKIPKIIGVFGVVGPFSMFILYGITGAPLIEWLLLFFIMIWINGLSLIIFFNTDFIPETKPSKL